MRYIMLEDEIDIDISGDMPTINTFKISIGVILEYDGNNMVIQ